MKELLVKVRTSEKGGSVKNKILITIVLMLFGFGIGILQKWIDGSAANILPVWLQLIDTRNYFGRLAIWILLGTVISVYSKSPLRAAINTFLFFISMLSGYYLYCNYALGFLPKTYMMMWIAISFLAFFLAYMCWYAKGEGIIAIVMSGIIIGVLFTQAFSITHGFYVYHLPEIITWMLAIVVLKRKPKELIMELGGIIYRCIFLSVDYAALGISSNNLQNDSSPKDKKMWCRKCLTTYNLRRIHYGNKKDLSRFFGVPSERLFTY